MIRRSPLAASLAALLLIVGCSDRQPAEQQAAETSKPASSVPEAAGAAPNDKSDTPQAADRLLEQARKQLVAKKPAAAFKTLQQCLKVNNQLAEAWFLRAGILADFGEDAEALRSFNRAVTLEPQTPQYRNARGFFLLSRNKLKEAIADFTEAIKIDPAYPQPYNNRGLALLAREEYQQAIADFSKAIELDPKYVDAFNNRGFAHLKIGKFDEARKDFDQAIALNPKYVNAFNNRAMLHAERGDLKAAVADLTAAIELDRYNASLYRYRAQAYRELGETGKARQDTERVAWLTKLERINRQLARRPQDPEVHIQRAELLAAGGEKDIALASFQAAEKVAPNHARIFVRRAEFWLEEGDFDKAIADCDRAIAIEPSTEAYSVRGDAYFHKGDYDKAIADFERARRIDVTVAEAYWRRARQHEAAGRMEAAKADRQRAIELEPSFAERN